MFRRLFAEGAFAAAFVPAYAKSLAADGEEAADRLAADALATLLAATVVICLLAQLTMPWLMYLIAPGFADIFFGNCLNNGLLTVILPPDQVKALMDEAKGGNHVFTVDLESQTVTAPSGAKYHFDIDPGRKEKLLKGLDAIGETLEVAKDIDLYEMKQALQRPWLEAAR